MTATQAVRGYGSTVEIGVGETPVYTKLIGVEEFEFPDQTPDTVDATHLESPNDTGEGIMGMRPLADWSVQVQYKPGNATDTLLEGLAYAEGGTGEEVLLRLKAVGGTAVEYVAKVKSWRVSTITAPGKMMATLTMIVMARIVE